MKIAEYWDHSREKWAERRIGKDFDDEVSVECVEDEGGVVHGGKKGSCGSAGGKVERKKVVVTRRKCTVAMERTCHGSLGQM